MLVPTRVPSQGSQPSINIFFPSTGSKVNVPKVPAQVLTKFLSEGSQVKVPKERLPSKVKVSLVKSPTRFPSKGSQAEVPK